MLSDNISQISRSARVNAFVSCLSDDEIKKYFLQRAVNVVSPWEFLLAKNTSKRQFVNTTKLYHDYVALRESLFESYPEMKLLAADGVVINSSHDISNVSEMVKFVLSNEKLLCKALLEAENGKILREKLMPLVLEKYQEHFVKFASGIVGSFCLGQKQLQGVLRNKWGKFLAGVLGINIIPPKALVVENLKKKKQELTQLIGLEFEVHVDVVTAKVNVAKYLEYLLSRPAVQLEKIAPKNKILFYEFTDLAPWLKWSRYFTGITTTGVKVVECQNLSRLVITTGHYYVITMSLLCHYYGQLKEIQPANCNGPVKVFYRSCADGKQRQIDSGNSSSRSTFPIPDSPEHTSLLGNMLVISKAPVMTYEDSRDMKHKYEKLVEKNPIARSEFAKMNLGNQGRENLTICNLQNYYPGTMHLAIRSVESLSIQIGMCAIGEFVYPKMIFHSRRIVTSIVTTDSTYVGFP